MPVLYEYDEVITQNFIEINLEEKREINSYF